MEWFTPEFRKFQLHQKATLTDTIILLEALIAPYIPTLKAARESWERGVIYHEIFPNLHPLYRKISSVIDGNTDIEISTVERFGILCFLVYISNIKIPTVWPKVMLEYSISSLDDTINHDDDSISLWKYAELMDIWKISSHANNSINLEKTSIFAIKNAVSNLLNPHD